MESALGICSGKEPMRTPRSLIQTAISAVVADHSSLSMSCKYLVSMPPFQQMDCNAVVDLHGALDWEDQ